jgi:hypothetical protein
MQRISRREMPRNWEWDRGGDGLPLAAPVRASPDGGFRIIREPDGFEGKRPAQSSPDSSRRMKTDRAHSKRADRYIDRGLAGALSRRVRLYNGPRGSQCSSAVIEGVGIR